MDVAEDGPLGVGVPVGADGSHVGAVVGAGAVVVGMSLPGSVKYSIGSSANAADAKSAQMAAGNDPPVIE